MNSQVTDDLIHSISAIEHIAIGKNCRLQRSTLIVLHGILLSKAAK